MTGAAIALVTFTLGMTLAVVVTGSASATSPTTTGTTAAPSPAAPGLGLDPKSGRFSVINGTVNAASDHEILASSAFPNYTTGAVDNYYSMAHTHLDNSPFAEATASPFDTGPIGQTAAAGNFQQSQYADARWPGGPFTAKYGDQGAPYADATAGNYIALANASEPSRALTGPNLKMPKGFDSKLQQTLDQWKKKWASVLGTLPAPAAKPPKAVTTPVTTVSTPTPSAPSAPTVTVTTPIATVTTPHVGSAPPAVAPPAAPAGAPRAVASAAAPKVPSLPKAPSAPKSSGDGMSLLTSSTQGALVPDDGSKTGIPKIDTTQVDTTETDTTQTVTDPKKLKPYTLVTRGESSLGRVKLGGGQIVVSGIHVNAAIANNGASPNPPYAASVSIGSASIGGVPVTIDQDGVHVAGHKQGVPYQQMSDSLNGALSKAGIQLFLVAPQVTTTSCGQTAGTGTDTTSTTTTTTTSTDQSGATASCGMCPPSGTGTDTGTTTTTTTTTTTSTDQSSTPPPGSCDTGAPAGCDQAGTGTTTTTGTSTTTSTTPLPSPTTTSTTTSTTPTTTSSAPGSCPPPSPAGSCASGTAAGTTTTSSTAPPAPGSGSAPSPLGPMGSTPSNEETVTATGLHVVFTQPVSPPGVPAQYVEHIFGEVFVDSIAGLAPPMPDLGLGLGLSSPSSSSPCGLGKRKGGKFKSGGGSSLAGGGGSSSAGGAGVAGSGATSGVLGASGSAGTSGSGSQLASGSTTGSGGGGSFPASVVHALHKPLWLLLAYLVWQLLVVGTGWSLWQWRKGRAAV